MSHSCWISIGHGQPARPSDQCLNCRGDAAKCPVMQSPYPVTNATEVTIGRAPAPAVRAEVERLAEEAKALILDVDQLARRFVAGSATAGELAAKRHAAYFAIDRLAALSSPAVREPDERDKLQREASKGLHSMLDWDDDLTGWPTARAAMARIDAVLPAGEGKHG